MTLASLLGLANLVRRRAETGSIFEELANGVEDLLAEADPCGFEAPRALQNPARGPFCVLVPGTWCDAYFPPDDARALARMLLRAADEADEENEKNAIRARLAKTTAPVK